MSNRRLLVVDDHPDFVSIVRRVGERRNFQVETLVESRCFQDVYRRFDPSVIMVDLFMPEVGGADIVRWLRESGNRAPVILTSGNYGECTSAAETLGTLGGEFPISALAKPVGLSDMAAAIERAGECAPNGSDRPQDHEQH